MTKILRPDLCVLGGGGAGLAAACEAARLGADVVVVEKRALGGAYLAQAIPAQAFCAAALANRAPDGPDLARLRARVKEIVRRAALEFSAARLAAINIKVIRAAGSFTAGTRLEAGGFAIDARHFIVSTGATPQRPAIAGLELVRSLDPEDLPALEDLPKELLVIGGNPHELALAQAFFRLGSRVTLLSPGAILPGEDQELVGAVLTSLAGEGLAVRQNVDILSVEPQRAGARVLLAGGEAIEAPRLIVGTRLVPCVEGFGLKTARVAYNTEGIEVDAEGRTSNSRIHAVGAVLGQHSAVLARLQGERAAAALFGRRQAAPLVARILCTDPEMAFVGLSEEAARAGPGSIRVLRAAFSLNQRALAAFGPAGHVKIVTDSRGQILGAGIVGPQARELIGIFNLAISKRMSAADLEGIVSTAATLTETCRAATLASAPQLGKA